MSDIFEFWSSCPAGANIHPEDESVLSRIDHQFELDCLPAPYTGPLRTAKVVLLFLAPGLAPNGFDARHAKTFQGRDWYARQLGGNEALPDKDEHEPHNKWWKSKTRQLKFEQSWVAQNVAILDLAPYHSLTFGDARHLAALPSVRASVGWAQSMLFPSAIDGERMVICLRSPEYWGLRRGSIEGKALFSPNVTRGGHMRHDELRAQIIAHAATLCDSDRYSTARPELRHPQDRSRHPNVAQR